MKRGLRITLFLVFGLLAVAAMGGAQEPIKIGVVRPHSGLAAPDGLSTLMGSQVAAQEINAAGGVLWRKIEIVSADSGAFRRSR